MTFLSKYRHLQWVLLLIPIYVFLFVKLGSPSLRLWDEGWFAVHAVEMMKQGSWLVSYFDGVPSFQSSKPPLQTWLQIVSLKALGISELAVRLPSAIAAAITVLLLFFSTKKVLDAGFAWMTSLILLTSIGFIGYHTARGAEADALLTLCLSLQGVFMFRFFETKNAFWLIWTALAMVLGFWTKSVATFLFVPGFLAYALIMKRSMILPLFFQWEFYVAIVLVGAGVVLYVSLRESVQPGYLDMFFRSNVGRYTSSVGHDRSFHYFIDHLLRGRYMWWFPFAIVGIVWSLLHRSSAHPWVLFSGIIAFSFLVFISFSRSKLVWYDMPFYPFAAVAAAFGVDQMLLTLRGLRKTIVLLVLFTLPTYHMFAHTQANRLTIEEMMFESQEIFLSKAAKRNGQVDGVKVIHDHFHGSMLFYKHLFEERGQLIFLMNNLEEVEGGDQVLISNKDMIDELGQHFYLDTLDAYKSAVLFQVNDKNELKRNDK